MRPLAPPPSTRPLQGIGWMVLAGLSIVITNGLIHAIGADLPAVQSAFLRFGWGCLFLSPLLLRLPRARVTAPVLRMLVLRGGVHSVAVACWFFALARLPVAESTAIAYLNPVLVMLGAVLFLRERLTALRVLALGGAVAGALIILRPGLREVTTAHLAMGMAAIGFAASFLMAKALLRTVSVPVLVAVLSLSVTLALAPFALWVWRPVSLLVLLQLGGVAVTATLGQYLMARAFQAAPMAVTQPVAFLQLFWATALGVLVFGEPVDPAVLLGALLIVASITAMALAERRNGDAAGLAP